MMGWSGAQKKVVDFIHSMVLERLSSQISDDPKPVSMKISPISQHEDSLVFRRTLFNGRLKALETTIHEQSFDRSLRSCLVRRIRCRWYEIFLFLR